LTLAALAAVRAQLRELENDVRKRAYSTRGVVVDIVPERDACQQCGGPTRVQKTKTPHHVETLEHGPFTAKETVLVCANRCIDSVTGRLLTVRSPELLQRVGSGAVYGYDVEVRVGLERYLHHRQRGEIQSILKEQGIELSTGQVSALATRFVHHLKQLHQLRSSRLRAALEEDGGYSLHIDATGEDGRGTVFAAYAGWREWVLGAWKLSTERSELILPCLQSIVRDFGAPCAIMRDLGPAVIKAAQQLVNTLPAKIPILSCHWHFLADVGKDLMEKSYDQLRELVRRSKLRTGLRQLSRDLGRRLGSQLQNLRVDIAEWTVLSTGHVVPTGDAGLAIVRALAQWPLDYQHDSTYGAFPFDRPYLDFYQRSLKIRRSVDAFLRTPPQDALVRRSLQRLARILDPVVSDVSFATTTERLSRRAALFDELREALRLEPKDNAIADEDASTKAAKLRDIKEALDRLTADLQARRPERGPAQDQRQAIDVILQHLADHGESLWGHAIGLTGRRDGEIRIVDRTNNSLEGCWHTLKHGERRRSGRKVLTYDFEGLPSAAILACNLTHPDYVEILCGSLENLPRAFAELDAAPDRKRLINSPSTDTSLDVPTDVEADLVSASLPRVDRPALRTENFQRRIDAAASSRAPHYHPRSKRCPTEF
jgi:hypothetical protein